METSVDIRINGDILQTMTIASTTIITIDRWIEIGDKRGDMNLHNLGLETIHLLIGIGIMLHINNHTTDHQHIIRCRE
jgi:hypothetical protein